MPARLIDEPYMHAKIIMGRGTAYFGSHNVFDTSPEDNREVGVVLCDGDDISELQQDLARTGRWQRLATNANTETQNYWKSEKNIAISGQNIGEHHKHVESLHCRGHSEFRRDYGRRRQ